MEENPKQIKYLMKITHEPKSFPEIIEKHFHSNFYFLITSKHLQQLKKLHSRFAWKFYLLFVFHIPFSCDKTKCVHCQKLKSRGRRKV